MMIELVVVSASTPPQTEMLRVPALLPSPSKEATAVQDYADSKGFFTLTKILDNPGRD